MWKWFNCYLSGRHDYGIWCESGAMFLRCMYCGKRSPGWSVDHKAQSKTAPVSPQVARTTPEGSRVVPFGRVALR